MLPGRHGRTLSLLAAGAAIAGGCKGHHQYSGPDTIEIAAAAPAGPMPVLDLRHLNLIQGVPVQRGPAGPRGIGGWLRVYRPPTAGPDGVVLHLYVDGLPAGTYAWRIHAAPCGARGEVLIPIAGAGTAAPLADPLVGGGAVEEVARIPRPALTAAQARIHAYSVRVHRPGDGDDVPPVACANL